MRTGTVRLNLSLVRRPALALVVALAIAASLSLATAGTADAGHVTCGQVITTDTTLDGDVGPCLGPQSGIVVGADGITLDLNGHEVLGDPNIDGENAQGIVITGRDSVTVTSSQPGGTVRDFDAGVAITNSTSTLVTGIEARDNIGDPTVSDFGDGIALFNSSDNTIRNNVVDHNGPFSGVGVFELGEQNSDRNTIEGNTIVNNDIPRSATVNDDGGVKLEPGASANTVRNNTIKGNGLEGVALFPDSTDNVVEGNDVRGNGFHNKTHRKGDGVRVFGRHDNPQVASNLVQTNTVRDNAANGIRVDSRGNDILDNATGGNGDAVTFQEEVGPLNLTVDVRAHLQVDGEEVQEPAPAFDLHDGNTDSEGNPSCDDNTWSGNTFDTAFPDCTKG